MNTDVLVHAATTNDKPEIWRLIRLIHAENAMFDYDESLVNEFLDGALHPSKKEGIVAVIRGEGSQIRGMIFLYITRVWYTQEYHIEELLSFVDPEFRESNYADALVRYAQHAATSLGVPLVIGILSHTRTLAKVRLYRRRLGMPAGAFFVYNAPNWVSERTPDLDLWKHTRKRKKPNDVAPIEALIATSVLDMLPMAERKLA